MSVSGRAGAGGGGPHQVPLPQTAEAMILYRFELGETQTGGSLDGPILCCKKLCFSLFPRPSECPSSQMSLQMIGFVFKMNK
jgi:hypothetical protein